MIVLPSQRLIFSARPLDHGALRASATQTQLDRLARLDRSNVVVCRLFIARRVVLADPRNRTSNSDTLGPSQLKEENRIPLDE